MKIKPIALIILLAASTQLFARDTFTWPNGSKAAVCLTYDDAISSHLQYAIPDLDKFDIKGTFYLSALALKPEVQTDWIAAAKNGHELASHAAFHPCSGKNDWVPADFATEDYSVDRMLKELALCNNLLYAMDGETVRTYAYPCCETVVGGVDYKSVLQDSGLYIAARGGKVTTIPDNMQDLDLFDVPCMMSIETPVNELINYIETARDKGTLAVFVFHGVADQYLKTDSQVHRDLLAYLDANKNDYWTATFKDVMQHVINERERLKK